MPTAEVRGLENGRCPLVAGAGPSTETEARVKLSSARHGTAIERISFHVDPD